MRFDKDHQRNRGRMIRVELDSQGLGCARFAVSPLGVAANLLHVLRQEPKVVSRSWQARAAEALRGCRLGLLAVLAGGGPRGYPPDFLRPEPVAFHTSVDTALHQVATASTERISYELTYALGGHSWDDTPAGRPPRLLLQALERGEAHVTQTVADQMQQFWQLVLAPDWARMQAQLEDDITFRSTCIAREGLTQTIDRLSPNLNWRDGGLDLHLSHPDDLEIDADAVIFIPTVFDDRATFNGCSPYGATGPRTPLILYPALTTNPAPPPLTHELIGNTRARLLALLTQPATTDELARRLHLSRATISYHLQILHRAGMLHRTRHSYQVFYQKAPANSGNAN
jgi:DNA-binding transcriptional ArsR family regulator